MKVGIYFLGAVAALALLLPQASAAGDARPSDFRYLADIEGDLSENALYAAPLAPEILNVCSPGCSDLRVFDRGGAEVPYVLIKDEYPNKEVETFRLEVVGYEDKGDASEVVLKMPGGRKPITVLLLNIADRDFNKRVLLQGSNDARTWKPVKDDSIYDFTSKVALRKTEIKIPGSDYAYYKILIEDAGGKQVAGGKSIRLKYEGLDFVVDGAAGPKKLRIKDVSGRTWSEWDRIVARGSRDFSVFKPGHDREGETSLTFEANLPFDRIALDVKNPYYYRRLSVYSSDTGEGGSFGLVGRGVVYRFPVPGGIEEANVVNLRSEKRRYYRITVRDDDSPPLDVRGIRLDWVRDMVFFHAPQNGGGYYLGVAGPNVAGPEYDMSKFVNQGNWHALDPKYVGISGVRDNPDFAPRTPRDFRARVEKWVLTAVIAVLTGIIGLWLFGLMKKVKAEGTGP